VTLDPYGLSRVVGQPGVLPQRAERLDPSLPIRDGELWAWTYAKSQKVKNLELISEDAAEFVRKLKAQEGKDICVMGGGLLAKSLFEANLIDEIGFNIHPVLLGSGIPIFHEMDHQIDLELLECKALKNGCVMVTYRVKH